MMPQSNKEKVIEVLTQFDTAMLITHQGPEELRARPMAIAKVTENGDLWFITSRESAKAHEIERDTHVHVVCQKGNTLHLSLSGTATLVEDRRVINELWKETYCSWFPNGKEDPSICLIKVVGKEAEYWDNEGPRHIPFAFEAVKAAFTGNRSNIEESDQHGCAKLN